MKESPLLEAEAWKEIVMSGGWKYLVDLVKRHCIFLNEQLIKHVKDGNHRGADRIQAKMEDCKKIVELVQKRMSELKGEKNG